MTLAVTVAQVWYEPVAAMATEPVRLVPEELSMCSASATAAGAATRKLTVYVPAVATSTVYLNHCPAPVQPTS